MAKKTKTKPKTAKKPSSTGRKLAPAQGPGQTDFYARERAKLADASSRGGGFWKPSKASSGRSFIRPFTFQHDGQDHLFCESAIHWKIDGQNGRMICCGSGCPVCELKGQVPDDVWEGIRPNYSYICNAVVRKTPGSSEPDRQQICQLPLTVYRSISTAVTGGKDGQDMIPNCLDPVRGYDFRILKVSDKPVKYETVAQRESSPIGLDVEPVDLYTRLSAPPSRAEAQKIADAILDRCG